MRRRAPILCPIHSYSEVLYYNVDFFEKNNLTVPTTWDEMVDTCSKIREITGAPAFGWDNLAGSFMTLVKQFGGRYTDQNGNIYFANEDTDAALKVLNLWKDNVDRGIWRTAGEDMFFSGPFANEQIPMYIGEQRGGQLHPQQESGSELGHRSHSSGQQRHGRQPQRRPCDRGSEHHRQCGKGVCRPMSSSSL